MSHGAGGEARDDAPAQLPATRLTAGLTVPCVFPPPALSSLPPPPPCTLRGGKDLNRDFPDRFASPSASQPGGGGAAAAAMQPTGHEQPETAAIMDWTLRTGFVASASMHEVGCGFGALHDT